MAVTDAITIGEGWISEHYFGSEGKQSFSAKVLERRKAWDDARKEGHETPRSRFLALRQSLLSTFSELGENALYRDPTALAESYAALREALGYHRPSLRRRVHGPATFVHAAGLEGAAPLVLVDAVPVRRVEELLEKRAEEGEGTRRREKSTLLVPFDLDDDGKEQVHAVARLISFLFVSEDAPQFVLVNAGPVALIAERERWAEGRYLAIDLQVVAERNEGKKGGEVDVALTCLDAASLAPDADGNMWWQSVLEDSVKHTVGVSKDLREGVRLSIEIIANEVVRRREAQGLDPLPQSEAQPLATESLRYLYRILFLLYAEASPELAVLPSGDPAYEKGYSLDRLRELTLVKLESPSAVHGTHLYQSLGRLFERVDRGHEPPATEGGDGEGAAVEGLTFQALRADLFRPSATSRIDEVWLGNGALQQVLANLLLSKEGTGKDRGFISYAELGINQLGAVYEGLMSYTGFFATEDLFEVAKDGNGEKGSWVVPVTRSQSIAEKDFVLSTDPTTGESRPVLHERGTFVYRLAGRERQQSASYYTPEVLTRFTVGQALVELIGPDDPDPESVEWKGREIPRRLTSSEILELTVCEPALGSGAFAIEAVRQLAEHYLKRAQEERGERIDPDQYPVELQRAKSYIALHNVYGVDLNATAVELAEISLWLDTMGKGLQAPWFGLHLKRGNSLIGARRAVFRTDQVASKSYLGKTAAMPKDVPLTETNPTGIHHFLLPADGWGSAVEAKEAKALAPDALALLKQWQKQARLKLSKPQVKELESLARRVETLWGFATERLRIAESEIRRDINVWGVRGLPVGGAVTREQIEQSLRDARGAYQRLRRVMDAWCALWFWPLTESLTTVTFDDGDGVIDPPSIDEWLAGLKAVLGTHSEAAASGTGRRWRGGDQTLIDTDSWEELGAAEELDLSFAGALAPEKFLDQHPWLVVAERIAAQQGFFHWELDFASVFANRGGFDLQVGNPPWVRPRSDVEALLAEGDPWWQLKAKSTAAQDKEHREYALSLPGIEELVVDGTADVACTAAFVGSPQQYPHLIGLQPDLYRCFMEQTWRHAARAGSDGGDGVVGLIHLESHFTDEKAGLLRAATYRRLRRHWQFINELQLFEIQHQKRYGVNVYGPSRQPHFAQAASLYHPETVTRSQFHDGSGPEPGIKDEDGGWDLRPHRGRIVNVSFETLRTWHAVLESDDVPIHQTRMVYAVNRATAAVLDKLAAAPRIGELGLQFSAGWHETADRGRGRFDVEWGAPGSWDDVILQGPHLFVGTPMYKTPNATMLHHLDWTAIDLEALPSDAVPVTSYKPRGDRAVYDSAYTHWTRTVPDDEPSASTYPQVDKRWVKDSETVLVDGKTMRRETVSARGFYRVAWRRMAANTGERTLISAIYPPGVSMLGTSVMSATATGTKCGILAETAGVLQSFLTDLLVRTAPKSGIWASTVERLPSADESGISAALALRALRLNCLTDAYARLWADCFDPAFRDDAWTGPLGGSDLATLGDIGPAWTPATPLRRARDRRQALVEIDALVALALGITADELCTIYRTQFPVLHGYDRNRDHYDANGRIVPNSVLTAWRNRGGNGSLFADGDLTAVHPGSGLSYTYVTPFVTLDREADLRRAHAVFAGRGRSARD